MDKARLSDYEKYILVAVKSRYAIGTYTNFLRLKEVMSTLNQMVSKNNNTYTYYGEVYVSNLTAPEINKIQECLDTGIWTSSFEKIIPVSSVISNFEIVNSSIINCLTFKMAYSLLSFVTRGFFLFEIE